MDLFLPTISLRNKAKNSLINEELSPACTFIINQTEVLAHIAQSSSNYLRINIRYYINKTNIT